jgi:hypothetical protein
MPPRDGDARDGAGWREAGLFRKRGLAAFLALSGDELLALRRELALVLLQAGDDPATAGLDAAAQLLDIGTAGLLGMGAGREGQHADEGRGENGADRTDVGRICFHDKLLWGLGFLGRDAVSIIDDREAEDAGAGLNPT